MTETGSTETPPRTGFHFFAFMSRMRYISRWGLMRNSTPENIQEHSLEVAIIAHALALIRNTYFNGTLDPERTATRALFHDSSEIFTGDLPTPVKNFTPDLKKAYRDLEDKARERLLAMLPPELAPHYRPIINFEDDPDTAAVIKAADRISALIKCLEELKSGNGEFRRAHQEVFASIMKNPLPEVAWFMEHMAEGYSLTLDELQQHMEGSAR